MNVLNDWLWDRNGNNVTLVCKATGKDTTITIGDLREILDAVEGDVGVGFVKRKIEAGGRVYSWKEKLVPPPGSVLECDDPGDMPPNWPYHPSAQPEVTPEHDKPCMENLPNEGDEVRDDRREYKNKD